MERIEKIWPGWEVVRKIGSGSFGSVYEIRRDVFGREEKAALKVLSIPESQEEIEELYNDGYDQESITTHYKEHLADIVREYSLMLEMKGHTNVVYCDDVKYVQHDDGIGWDIYIKMELLTPLTKVVPAAYDEAQTVRLGVDLCNALILCKQQSIVHRDIKPQNIFVSRTGDYKLGDFGVAKISDKTATGTKVGTFDYMAPEVYRGGSYGSGADIYSLGLVLYWMMNQKRTPFLPLTDIPSASAKEEARNRRFHGEALPEPANGSDALKAIVLKACAFDPKDRYQTAAEMREDLKKLDTGAVLVPPVIPAASVEPVPGGEVTMKIFPGKQAQPAPSGEGTVNIFGNKNTEEKTEYIREEKTEYIPRSAPIPEEKKKKKNWLFPVIAIVLVIAILLVMLRSCGDGPAGPGETTGSTPGTTQTESTTVPTTGETTVPPTTEVTEAPSVPTVPQQAEWSGWLDSLPEYVSNENYLIEELTLYRSREMETTTSTTQNSMDGWEHYDTVEADGGYGPWSDWSGTAVSATDSRQVETQQRYRYRNKEFTTGTSSTKNGWTLYNTTYAWSSYGSWSGWSTAKVTASDSRKVETKTQYSYRTKTVTQEYTEWSEWSGWQDDYVSEDAYTDVETRTVWAYYYFLCPNCGDHMHGYGSCYTWAGGCGAATNEGCWRQFWLPGSWDAAGFKEWYGTGKYYTTIDGQIYFKWSSQSAYTQYRYRTRSLQDVVTYSAWSAYSDTKRTATSTRDVRTRTMYRYCDRTQIPTYYFWRWGSWSDWTATAVSGNDSRQVEKTTYYRYREHVTTTTYCFRRWKAWSDYSEIPVSPAETVEVETKTQYRFKSK